jgi:hypothetical protein
MEIEVRRCYQCIALTTHTVSEKQTTLAKNRYNELTDKYVTWHVMCTVCGQKTDITLIEKTQ